MTEARPNSDPSGNPGSDDLRSQRLCAMYKSRADALELVIECGSERAMDILDHLGAIGVNEFPIDYAMGNREHPVPHSEAVDAQNDVIDMDHLHAMCANLMDGMISDVNEQPAFSNYEVTVGLIGALPMPPDGTPERAAFDAAQARGGSVAEGATCQYNFQTCTHGIRFADDAATALREWGADEDCIDLVWRKRKLAAINRCSAVLSRELALNYLFPIAALVLMPETVGSRHHPIIGGDGVLSKIFPNGSELWAGSARTLAGDAARTFAGHSGGSVKKLAGLGFDEMRSLDLRGDPFSASALLSSEVRFATYRTAQELGADGVASHMLDLMHADGILPTPELRWINGALDTHAPEKDNVTLSSLTEGDEHPEPPSNMGDN